MKLSATPLSCFASAVLSVAGWRVRAAGLRILKNPRKLFVVVAWRKKTAQISETQAGQKRDNNATAARRQREISAKKRPTQVLNEFNF
jgi:hypothetical protein